MEKLKKIDLSFVLLRVTGFAAVFMIWIVIGAPLIYGMLNSPFVIESWAFVQANPVSMIGIVGGVVLGRWVANFTREVVAG